MRNLWPGVSLLSLAGERDVTVPKAVRGEGAAGEAVGGGVRWGWQAAGV